MRVCIWLVMLLVVGCATEERKKTPKVPFALDMPESMRLLNGATVKRDVAVNWEPAEREDLDVSAAVDPDGKGVTATVEPAKLPRGVGPIQVEIHASETAAPGEYVLKLTAKGKSGEAKGTMKLEVPRRD